MDNRRKLELVKEATKRKLLTEYKTNFEQFAKQQIKIITKDASKGFVPFVFNEAQQKVNEALEQQLKENYGYNFMAVALWTPRWPHGSPNAHPKTAPVPGRRFFTARFS